MEPPVVSIKEGELILKMGSKVTALDLEKYTKFLILTTEDRNLLPKRIFITLGTFLFSVVYISLILPSFLAGFDTSVYCCFFHSFELRTF